MPAAQPHPPEKVIRVCDVLDLSGGGRGIAKASTPKVSTPTKAWNLTKAVSAWARSGFKTVDKAAYHKRLKICDTCPKRNGNWCAVCGCNLSAKAMATAWHCPLGKWPGDKPKP